MERIIHQLTDLQYADIRDEVKQISVKKVIQA